jgi:hypothetical protein
LLVGGGETDENQVVHQGNFPNLKGTPGITAIIEYIAQNKRKQPILACSMNTLMTL